ncbi:hypothetical protein [Pediococcus inopinatus]|uniref:hypothetical protein n=1 Tax=Pediococcus inopinatus TaxID=114090 RepID=UPI00070DDBBC|nr:hypothetical protein [Pediococcus inopinatus]AVK99188.1 hypothetical protein PI20285_00175 [Pediococcus inopinatus]KRN60918.1 hypothetical protein IV83_GL001222 [Pediococcus inopinatus]
MTVYKKSFFSKIGKKIVRFLNYNAKKALNIYIAVLALTAVANVAYIGFLANITQVTLRNFLDKNPINTVMLIITIMDTIVAYILWMEKDHLLDNQKRFQGTLIYLSVLQILVGNFVAFILGIIAFFTSQELPQKGNKYFEKNELVPLVLIAVVYLFCLFLLLKLAV